MTTSPLFKWDFHIGWETLHRQTMVPVQMLSYLCNKLYQKSNSVNGRFLQHLHILEV